MKGTRESNYDLLRVISAIAVISIHVSGVYLDAITNKGTFGDYYLNGMMISCIYFVIAKFAVPCFIMLSGAFILADERNINFKYFYRKTFVRIGIPTLIFSAAYFLYSMLLAVMSVAVRGNSVTVLLEPVRDLLRGGAYYHMWYVYMIIGIYLLVPLIMLFKRQVGEKIFFRVSWVFLVIASFGALTSTSKLNWDVGFIFRFVGYFMVGYVLRRITKEKKNNVKGILFIIMGFMVEMAIVAICYFKLLLDGIPVKKLEPLFTDPLCPMIVIASVCIFAGFSKLSIKRDFGKVSALTFLIYLFHAGVWRFLSVFIRKAGFEWDNRIVIPVSIIVVLLISVILSKLYLVVWKWAEDKWKLSNKLCKVLRLEQQ